MIGWLPVTDDEKVASVRYRTLWPVIGLRQRGRMVSLFQRGARHLYSALLFSKRAHLEDLNLGRQTKERGGSVIFDLCDNHFYNPQGAPEYRALRTRLLAMVGMADRVICSTRRLAEVVGEETGRTHDIHVVGDFVEHITLPPLSATKRKLPMLLWFGSHGSDNADAGMLDLLNITEYLLHQYRRAPFELVVVSNNREKFDTHLASLPLPVRYIAWNTEAFPATLVQAAAVLLPLSNNPFVACKTHNRISLALRAGIPVVGDLIDSYSEFAPYAYLDCWPDGLEAVIERPAEAKARASAAEKYIDEVWSPTRVIDAWDRALKPFLDA